MKRARPLDTAPVTEDISHLAWMRLYRKPEAAEQRKAGASRVKVAPATVTAVAHVIMSYADVETGTRSFCGHDEIASQLDISTETVRLAVNVLLGTGWLLRTVEGRTAPKRNFRNEYRLTVPRWMHQAEASRPPQMDLDTGNTENRPPQMDLVTTPDGSGPYRYPTQTVRAGDGDVGLPSGRPPSTGYYWINAVGTKKYPDGYYKPYKGEDHLADRKAVLVSLAAPQLAKLFELTDTADKVTYLANEGVRVTELPPGPAAQRPVREPSPGRVREQPQRDDAALRRAEQKIKDLKECLAESHRLKDENFLRAQKAEKALGKQGERSE